jgi:hypothetical protein
MALSRKHYIEIAGIMREAKTRTEAVMDMSDYFASENPRFDRAKFRKAAKRNR